jgi:hypothetical protein
MTAPSRLLFAGCLSFVCLQSAAMASPGETGWTVSAGALATSLNQGLGPMAEVQQDVNDNIAFEAIFATTFPSAGTERYIRIAPGLDVTPIGSSNPDGASVHGRPHVNINPGLDYTRDYVEDASRVGFLWNMGIGYAVTIAQRVTVDATVGAGASIRINGQQDPTGDIVPTMNAGLTVGYRI